MSLHYTAGYSVVSHNRTITPSHKDATLIQQQSSATAGDDKVCPINNSTATQLM